MKKKIWFGIFLFIIIFNIIITNYQVKLVINFGEESQLENQTLQVMYDSGTNDYYPFTGKYSSYNLVKDSEFEKIFKIPVARDDKIRINFVSGNIDSFNIDSIELKYMGIPILCKNSEEIFNEFKNLNDIQMILNNEKVFFIVQGNDPYIENMKFTNFNIELLEFIMTAICSFIVTYLLMQFILIMYSQRQRIISILSVCKNKLFSFIPFIYCVWIFGNLVLAFISEWISNDKFNIINQFPIYILSLSIIFTITSLVFILKNKLTIYFLISIFILIISSINKMIISFRGVPLTFSDIYSLRDGLSILNNYINNWMIYCFFIILIIMFVLIFNLIKKEKKIRESYSKLNIIPFIISLSVTILLVKIYNLSGILISQPWNIAYEYEYNGFTYSLLSSATETIRKVPKNYSKDYILDLKETINTESNSTLLNDSNPNIIIVQLESFFDPTSIEGLEFSKNPLSFYNSLRDNYTSGDLYVPTFGGGTVRTEFEILTGMNIDYLSPGEIPNSTILKKSNIFSLAHNLNQQGYTSHFVHNNRGDFYQRNVVYKNLGFNTFSSIEYFANYTIDKYWPKDESLVTPILDALNTTIGSDFIYVVTVESHGGYSSEKMENPIRVKGDLKQEVLNQIENYSNVLYEVDKFINNLVEEVNQLQENTVIVFLSDHLPQLLYFNDMVNTDNYKNTTEYIIYDNFNLEKQDDNIETYQLSTKILSLLGLNLGPIENIHRFLKDNDDYQEILEIIQFDILFKDRLYYNNSQKQLINEMQMGINPVELDNYFIEEDALIIKGKNFNTFSKVYLDNKLVLTEYIDSETLRVNNIKSFKSVSIKQVTSEGVALSSTVTLKN
ncbi:sulfatase-like hydrolase/transferase [Turicibacter sanguinis]|uniref:LTA synthase family protein n=1 Tax=Turicibacter sanguinis TaxID=154288 RepID=UPI00189AC4EA|nr:LTA synthase family protein [Turicibacter sanguinis]MDB8545130.1 sulfatase-like hydrolase/transferase [Turicibacter sanguinis]